MTQNVMVWIYTLASVLIVSLISVIGIFALTIDQKKLNKILMYLVSLSAGTLLGDAFIHLLPEAYASAKTPILVSLFTLGGILVFFVLEKFFHWRHCHEVASADHPHPFSFVILVGDSIHNLIDGMVIAGSFLISIPVGIATTVAVIFHEIPQEIGDFGSLVYGGFSRKKAILFNFLSGLLAVLGAIIVLAIGKNTETFLACLIPFTAGGFIYIASSDLIPELHKHTEIKKSFGQLLMFLLGIAIMTSLIFVFE